MKKNNLQRDLFKAYNPPGDIKATTLCYKTKTFTVWPSENHCVIHSFGTRTPLEHRKNGCPLYDSPSALRLWASPPRSDERTSTKTKSGEAGDKLLIGDI